MISPSLPERRSPSRCTPTTAASNRERNSLCLIVWPITVAPGSNTTSVRFDPNRPSSRAKDRRPWNRSNSPTLETSPEKISLSPASSCSPGETGVSRRPSRTTSTKKRSPRSRKPFAAMLLPIRRESSATSISMRKSLTGTASLGPRGSALRAIIITTSPASAAGKATGKKAKNAMPLPVTSSRKLLTIRLVEVPIRVRVPPRIAA